MTGGLTSAAVVIPKAMACAVIAGLPVEAGLYTALAAMLVYPLLGSSRPLSVSTTTAISILTAAQVVAIVSADTGTNATTVASTLALLVGAVLIFARLARLGFLANFISMPVLVGFEAGVGIVVLVGQVKYLLGVNVSSHTTIGTLLELPGLLTQAHGVTFLVGAAGIAILSGLPRLFPRLSAPLMWVALSILASAALGLESLGVKSVGTVPSGLPSLMLPDLSLAPQLWPAALGIALLSFTESVAAARTFSQRGDEPISANRELFAVGAANVASAMVGGMPAGGGTSQTAVADAAHVRSQMAQWVNVIAVLVCLLFLSGLISLMPQAALGAVIIVVAASMIKPAKFRAIARIRRTELIWAFVALAGVVMIGTLAGILIAVIISVLMLMYQANHPPVYAVAYNRRLEIFRPVGEDERDETFPGLLILRTEGRLTFANAANASEKMKALVAQTQPTVLVLECSAIPDIEYTALVMLIEAEENLRARGITLWLAGVNPDMLRTVSRSPLGEILGSDRIFQNLRKALETYLRNAGTPLLPNGEEPPASVP